MFIYRKTIKLNDQSIEIELNRLLRRIKVTTDGITLSSFISFKKNISINDIDIIIKAFPVWNINIKSPEAHLKNIFPILKRKSERYLIGISFIALCKLLVAVAVNLGF